MTLRTSMLLTTSALLLGVSLAACTEERQPDAKAQGVVQETFVQALEARGVDLDHAEAFAFVDWYCSNRVAPMSEIQRRALEAGTGAGRTAEVIQAADVACRSAERPTGG